MTQQECNNYNKPAEANTFLRPVSEGYVSCEFGNTCYEGHTGVDFGGQ